MHEKYAGKGVACVSVSIDSIEDKDDVLAFLKKQKATLTNLLLDERQKVWQQHFDIAGPPAVLVYDQEGKLAKRFTPDEDFTYADVEKLVQKLLKQ
jgi:hypothetical protein